MALPVEASSWIAFTGIAMATAFPCVEPVQREDSSSNGLGIRAWRDAEGTRLYDVHDAAKLLGLTYGGLHKRGLPGCKLGRRAFVSAEVVERQRREDLEKLGAAERVVPPATGPIAERDGGMVQARYATHSKPASAAGEDPAGYRGRDVASELAAATERIAELEAEVNGLLSDLRGAAAAEETWKGMYLRRLPVVTDHD